MPLPMAATKASPSCCSTTAPRLDQQTAMHAGRCHGKIPGGSFNGTHADDMIGEIALAIQMGADAVDIGKTIHPHPHAD